MRSGRLRCQVAIFCWTLPWLFSKRLSGALVPRRLHPSLRVLITVMFAFGMSTSARNGQVAAAVLGGLSSRTSCCPRGRADSPDGLRWPGSRRPRRLPPTNDDREPSDPMARDEGTGR